jgi:hypothetical protein
MATKKTRKKARKKAPTKKAATKKANDGTPVEIDPNFRPVVAAFAREPQVVADKGWGAGNTVLKVKGKIFAMTMKGDLVAKLPKARAAELVADGTGVYFDPRRDGRLMKEWVVVRAGRASWIELAREAHRFVSAAK